MTPIWTGLHAVGAAVSPDGRAELAEEAARKRCPACSRNDYAHYFFGEALRLRGNSRLAIPELEKALQLGSVNEWVRYSLAMAYVDVGELGKARDAAEQLQRLQPGFKGMNAVMRRIEDAEVRR